MAHCLAFNNRRKGMFAGVMREKTEILELDEKWKKVNGK